jgi:threonine aldolase
MRQAGVLAAAGLIALDEMPKRLHEDHVNARMLAEAIARCQAAEIDPADVQTNIVVFTLHSKNGYGDAPAIVKKLREHGVLASAIGPHAIRLVTHYDVTRADCERAAEVFEQITRS